MYRRMLHGLETLVYWLLLLLLCFLLGGTAGHVEAAPEGPTRIYLPYYVMSPNKLGIAGGDAYRQTVLGASWYYAWCPTPDPTGREAVPMIWGPRDYGKTPEGNSQWVMGFNELDLLPGSMGGAVAEWYDLETRCADRLLMSPAPSDLHPDWLSQFRDAFFRRFGRWPRFDGIAIHCYRSADNCIALIQHYKGLAEGWGVQEGWVTEFAYTPEAWGSGWRDELEKLVSYMDNEPWITRYSPYVSVQDCSDGTWPCAAAGNPSLFETDGLVLTDIGRAYARRN